MRTITPVLGMVAVGILFLAGGCATTRESDSAVYYDTVGVGSTVWWWDDTYGWPYRRHRGIRSDRDHRETRVDKHRDHDRDGTNHDRDGRHKDKDHDGDWQHPSGGDLANHRPPSDDHGSARPNFPPNHRRPDLPHAAPRPENSWANARTGDHGGWRGNTSGPSRGGSSGDFDGSASHRSSDLGGGNSAGGGDSRGSAGGSGGGGGGGSSNGGGGASDGHSGGGTRNGNDNARANMP